MSELTVIAGTPFPRTRKSLSADLVQLGLHAGDVIILHCSLRSIGWVCGGSVAVIEAVLDVIGPTGTLVMPAHSGDLSDPATWSNPPVPSSWWGAIRNEMPAYDPRLTPTLGLGRTAEIFRAWPGSSRSAHPVMSFAAVGPLANAITQNHPLDFPLGDASPLARIYDLDGRVLLVGVGHERNTSFHLAENRAAVRPTQDVAAPILVDGERIWTHYKDLDADSDCFEAIGSAFEEEHGIRHALVGSATARIFSQRAAVDFAVNWFGSHGRQPK